jgi:hypothetical protein
MLWELRHSLAHKARIGWTFTSGMRKAARVIGMAASTPAGKLRGWPFPSSGQKSPESRKILRFQVWILPLSAETPNRR